MREEELPPVGALETEEPGEMEAMNVNQATREGMVREAGRTGETAQNEGTGHPNKKENSKYKQEYGNALENKNNGKMRIITIQMNGYPIPPLNSRGRAKTMVLEELLGSTEADIILTQEENRKWDAIKKKDTPEHKFDYIRIVTNHTYNEENNHVIGTHQQGGTAVWTMGRARGYITKHR